MSWLKSIFRERNSIFLEIIICDPSIYTMDHHSFTVSKFKEKSDGLQRFNRKFHLLNIIYLRNKEMQQSLQFMYLQVGCVDDVIS